jgi:glycosyltransferase involved in cell wall biosynthesis
MIIGHYMRGLSDAGGIASYIRRIAAAQRAEGHNVALFDGGTRPFRWRAVADRVECAHDAGAVFEAATAHGVEILHVHAVLPFPHRPPLPMIRTLLSHQPYCPSGSRYLARGARACDRAYSVMGCTWGHLIDRCGSIRPLHFADDFRRTRAEWLQAKWVHVLAVSEFLKDQMIRSGYDPAGISVLHLPSPEVADPLPPTDDQGPRRFLFTGRIVPQKGLSWLVEAFALACRATPDLHLDVAGDGPQREGLASRCAELGLAQRVTFHGWLPEAKVFDLIRLCQAVVFPSVWHEPAGLVTLEAAAHGRPVIVSRVGGIPEYAAGLGNAIVVEPEDIGGLSAAIVQLAGDRGRAAELGSAGLQASRSVFGLRQHMEALSGHYTNSIRSWSA